MIYTSSGLTLPDRDNILIASFSSYSRLRRFKSSIWLYQLEVVRSVPSQTLLWKRADLRQWTSRIGNHISFSLLVRKWSDRGRRTKQSLIPAQNHLTRDPKAWDEIRHIVLLSAFRRLRSRAIAWAVIGGYHGVVW